jgi:hypothetical protein
MFLQIQSKLGSKKSSQISASFSEETASIFAPTHSDISMPLLCTVQDLGLQEISMGIVEYQNYIDNLA